MAGGSPGQRKADRAGSEQEGGGKDHEVKAKVSSSGVFRGEQTAEGWS